MSYIVWIILGVTIGYGIFWLLDWKKRFPDGE